MHACAGWLVGQWWLVVSFVLFVSVSFPHAKHGKFAQTFIGLSLWILSSSAWKLKWNETIKKRDANAPNKHLRNLTQTFAKSAKRNIVIENVKLSTMCVAVWCAVNSLQCAHQRRQISGCLHFHFFGNKCDFNGKLLFSRKGADTNLNCILKNNKKRVQRQSPSKAGTGCRCRWWKRPKTTIKRDKFTNKQNLKFTSMCCWQLFFPSKTWAHTCNGLQSDPIRSEDEMANDENNSDNNNSCTDCCAIKIKTIITNV